jgi:hypothetical protein
MARRFRRPPANTHRELEPFCHSCWLCGRTLWKVDLHHRTVATMTGLVHYTVQIRACPNPVCERFQRPYHPEAEGVVALPHGEFGLDVIAFVGAQRYQEHRSVPEIHAQLRDRGVAIAERTVTDLLHRYEELVTLRLADRAGLRERLAAQKHVVLAIDGLQPDVGHEVLWVIRDLLSGEFLLVRPLLSATQEDLAQLLREAKLVIPVPICGVVSDGQLSIRCAVKAALPGVPHQLCHFHYLREAALPIYEADRHAKKELKKQVRGVRPIERSVEGRDDPGAQATRAYCLAVRSALTEDGRPPLCAAGLRLHERLSAIHASLGRAAEKGDCRPNFRASTSSSTGGLRRRPRCGRPSAPRTRGFTRQPTCWTRKRPSGSKSGADRIAGCWRRCRGNARRSANWSRRSPGS